MLYAEEIAPVTIENLHANRSIPKLRPENYKLLTNLVVPRPIAWVTSVNAGGVVNLAPFSFFNAVSGNPLYLIISIGAQ